MKITALMGLGYSMEEINEALSLNPLRVAEHTLFKDKASEDYRNEAIDKTLELNVPFTTTANTLYGFVTRFVKVACPKCGAVMQVKSGGSRSINYFCTGGDNCKSVVILTFDAEGIAYRPKYTDRR